MYIYKTSNATSFVLNSSDKVFWKGLLYTYKSNSINDTST